MLYKEKKQVSFFQSELLLSAGISNHGFFTKGLLNMSFDEQTIEQSLSYVLESFPLKSMTYMHQVHATDMVLVNHFPVKKRWQCVRAVDGLMTQERGQGLLVKHADCQAALIFDPKHRVVAALHVGWRGAVADFFMHAFRVLYHQFSTEAKDCLVAISPSLGPEAAEFKGYQDYFPPFFTKALVKENHFDLWHLSFLQLQSIGVKSAHIDIAKICTYANAQLCHSYRNSNEKNHYKRGGSFISL
ncbi:hypothetical protein COB21_02490 [Candidatus Aerophobetes bacterium]|uniref:Purine nucleoside phosphorylase n=1 Tax=Aerophobetes bacterium TaxID=2030807 RepID=A0A2A4X6A8_UNCAE|nr:MAG: hypothetical protein COB21_02490 [Candidatus Aerophobetes bacterium]